MHGRPPTTEEQLVEKALELLAVLGPERLKVQDVCQALGCSKALVNYHFGSRDGLIHHAIALGYERYVDHLWAESQAAGDDPVDQLLSWIDAQVDWTVANAGLAMALNFSALAAVHPLEFPPEIQERLGACGVRNFENLATLLAAARRATAPDLVEVDEVTNALDSAVVGWTTLGLSVWLAGRHAPTSDYRQDSLIDAGREHMRQRILALIQQG